MKGSTCEGRVTQPQVGGQSSHPRAGRAVFRVLCWDMLYHSLMLEDAPYNLNLEHAWHILKLDDIAQSLTWGTHYTVSGWGVGHTDV